MRDPTLLVRQKYHDLLHEQISYNGTPVKFFDHTPPVEIFPYVLFSQQTSNESAFSCKDNLHHDTTITFDVVTGFDGKHGGGTARDVIGNSILNLINWNADEFLDLSPDFKMTFINLDSMISLPPELTDQRKIFRKTITIRHEIVEL